jgi:hypothetical protein
LFFLKKVSFFLIYSSNLHIRYLSSLYLLEGFIEFVYGSYFKISIYKPKFFPSYNYVLVGEKKKPSNLTKIRLIDKSMRYFYLELSSTMDDLYNRKLIRYFYKILTYSFKYITNKD